MNIIAKQYAYSGELDAKSRNDFYTEHIGGFVEGIVREGYNNFTVEADWIKRDGNTYLLLTATIMELDYGIPSS